MQVESCQKVSYYLTVQVFLPNKLYKLNKKLTLIEKVNYSTRVTVADLSTSQSINVLYIFTAKYFILLKKNPTTKESAVNQEYNK